MRYRKKPPRPAGVERARRPTCECRDLPEADRRGEQAEVILNNIDLIEGAEIPPAFLHALAHINAYRAILAQWDANDFSEYTSVNIWPYEELIAVVQPTFSRIRAEQMRLLGQKET